MKATAEQIDHTRLLTLANQYAQQHKAFFENFRVTGVTQQDELLIFSGPLFTDNDGVPTPKTLTVFNILKFLAVELSPRYRLK